MERRSPRFPFTLATIAVLSSALFLSTSQRTEAQEFWKHFERPEVGAGLEFLVLRDEADEFVLPMYKLGAGFNLPVVTPASNLTLGINPGLYLSSDPSSDYAGSSVLGIQAPLFATVKLNTDATWKGSRFPIGFTAGFGARYDATFFINSGRSETYLLPSYLAEINFGSRRGSGLFKVRWIAAVEPFYTDRDVMFRPFSIQLLWVPGY